MKADVWGFHILYKMANHNRWYFELADDEHLRGKSQNCGWSGGPLCKSRQLKAKMAQNTLNPHNVHTIYTFTYAQQHQLIRKCHSLHCHVKKSANLFFFRNYFPKDNRIAEWSQPNWGVHPYGAAWISSPLPRICAHVQFISHMKWIFLRVSYHAAIHFWNG